MNEYCIYMLTSPSGKSYIGQTKNIKERMRSHKKEQRVTFDVEFKNIGWENIKLTILEKCDTRLKAHELEFFYIEKFKTLVPHGYNLKQGGVHGSYSDESRKKMSDSAKGKESWNKGGILTAEHRKKLSDAKKGKAPFPKGKVFSDEHKLRLSIARRKRVITEETKAKMSFSLKGKKRTPEQLENYKAAAQKRLANKKE